VGSWEPYRIPQTNKTSTPLNSSFTMTISESLADLIRRKQPLLGELEDLSDPLSMLNADVGTKLLGGQGSHRADMDQTLFAKRGA
jgi:hypothetical protein